MAQAPVQNPLSVFIPIKQEAVADLREKLNHEPIKAASFDALGTVHFARLFLFEEGNPSGIPSNIFAAITSYDGDFTAYVQAFLNQQNIADVLNLVMSVADVPGAAALVPVTKNAAAVAAFLEKFNVTSAASAPWGEWYSAYPTLTVQNILHPN